MEAEIVPVSKVVVVCVRKPEGSGSGGFVDNYTNNTEKRAASTASIDTCH